MSDWTGNANSIFKTLGSSHHTVHDRQSDDYYATDPKAVSMLLDLEDFSIDVWECACGEGHLSREIARKGHFVKSTDLVDRGYGVSGVDFLSDSVTCFEGDIITNPPYKYAKEFILKALEVIPTGNNVAMFLKVQFLEGKSRKNLFTQHPPKTIYISSSRIACAINGDFTGLRSSGGSAVAYAWFVWVKGNVDDPVLKWFN